MTLNRYAVRVSWDRSTLSRFLSGALVPPAEFVEQLIDDGDREAGAELNRSDFPAGGLLAGDQSAPGSVSA
ncbi:hypothetical protein ACIA8F_22130 [Streptomyces sp. NPDC051563]|uniref:hypothetical protein n=1 Tax=Streptomyces sp. NPDC051563 TaxID=3365659 RepID=UPI00378FF466